ncbi:hypothetical protein AAK899_06755 [Erysipelotrichaceae bacterium 51-3]
MNNLQQLFLHLLSCTAGLYALCGLGQLYPLKKPVRPLEGIMVVTAVLYSLIASWILLDHTSQLVALLPDWLSESNGIDLPALSTMFLFGYALIRFAVDGILRLLQSRSELVAFSALDFYEQDPASRQWHLKQGLAGFQRLIQWTYLAALGMSVLFLTLVWTWPNLQIGWVSWLPVALLPFLMSVRVYLDGLPPLLDPKRKYSGSGIDALDICNYYGLRSVYEENLPEPLLTSTAGCDLRHLTSALNLVETWRKHGGEIEQIAAEYYAIHQRFTKSDPDCAAASIDLLKGRNVVFFNPFYRDLSLYLTLPLASTLLAGDHVLILCGRKSLEQPAREWIEEAIGLQTRTEHLWTIRQIDDQDEPCQIGIMTFNQIYNHSVLKNNQDFFHKVQFVILLEPSKLIGTSQTALSIIASNLGESDRRPVYAVCDRQTTGLIDTLSHVLKSEFIEACASPVPHCLYTAMFWDADGEFRRQEFFDHQSRYLGNGLELAALAIRCQVPQVKWIGETKVPLKDLRRIAGQSYQNLCRFMNIKVSQHALFERVDFVDSLWQPKMEKRPFLIVEDEFNNLFATLHPYLARGTGQSFVHMLSENYLLRDYMKENREVFASNPQAVPSLIPDYARTERNTILKLLLLMNMKPVDEETIARELRMTGILNRDLENEINRLVRKYTPADETIFTIHRRKKLVNEFTQKVVVEYSISDEAFSQYFQSSLKNAYFVVEDELANREYLDAKLYGQIVQAILPGQFLTYGGKYYQVHSINPMDGVVLRRASDLYEGREYYRQKRIYTVTTSPAEDTDGLSESTINPTEGETAELVSFQQIGSIELRQERHNFSVETPGYLRLRDNQDLEHGIPYTFQQEGRQEIFNRSYLSKTLLRVKMPEMDTQDALTFCVLLNELFRTVYPENWPYLCAAAVYDPLNVDPWVSYLVPQVKGNFDQGEVLILEDSEMDLGLIDSFCRNFDSLMGIVYDYLDWLENPVTESTEATTDEVDFDALIEEIKERKKEEAKKKRFFARWKARHSKKNKDDPEKPDSDSNPDQTKEEDSSSGKQASDSQQEQLVPFTRPVTEDLKVPNSVKQEKPEATLYSDQN